MEDSDLKGRLTVERPVPWACNMEMRLVCRNPMTSSSLICRKVDLIKIYLPPKPYWMEDRNVQRAPDKMQDLCSATNQLCGLSPEVQLLCAPTNFNSSCSGQERWIMLAHFQRQL